MFTTKQQRDMINAPQMGKGLIYPSKKQCGGFLGTLLASIGIPMAIDLVKNMISGKGAPRIGMYTSQPPFYSYPPYVTGQSVKKKKEKDYYYEKTVHSKTFLF